LAGDRLGCFNLTLRGHAMCVNFMKSYGLPLLVLGGGGYTIRNVARCWTYETAQLLDAELSDQLPYNDYLEYYGPDFRLHIEPSNMENQNHKEYLEKHLVQLIENIRQVEHAPSVAPFSRPPDHFSSAQDHAADEEQDQDPDTRMHASEEDKKVFNEKELYDPDDKRRDPQKDTDYEELFSKREAQLSILSNAPSTPVNTTLTSSSIPKNTSENVPMDVDNLPASTPGGTSTVSQNTASTNTESTAITPTSTGSVLPSTTSSSVSTTVAPPTKPTNLSTSGTTGTTTSAASPSSAPAGGDGMELDH